MGITLNVPRPRFDPTLNWGHILTAVTFIAFGFGAFFAVKGDIGVLDTRTSGMEKSLSVLSTAVQTLADKAIIDARQDERIIGLDRRVGSNESRLDRMEGRVTPR